MKKLILGIVDFRSKVQEGYRLAFGNLAIKQTPDTLFIACSDSRVVPNTFASTNPGDLFVLRNMGNMIPPCDDHGHSISDESEAAAIEFALKNLNVQDIVVCGHSECGAMQAIMKGRENVPFPNMKSWLRHGEDALAQLKSGLSLDPELTPHNQLSQLNVLLQIEHIQSYPAVQERMAKGNLGIHGWWFDIAKADVYAFIEEQRKFVLIDEDSAKTLIEKLEKN